MASNPIVRTAPLVARSLVTPPSIPNADSSETPPTQTRPNLDRALSADSNSVQAGLETLDDPAALLLKAFLPTVAVFPSQDVEELVRLKGIYGGLCGLLKPFGEIVQGKVAIRDSNGYSKNWEGLGIRFVPFSTDIETFPGPFLQSAGAAVSSQDGDWTSSLRGASEIQNRDLDAIDEVLEHHLRNSDGTCEERPPQSITPPYYEHFLKKLFSQRRMTPHETFSHPVGCVIAVSSQNPAPIDALRDLYHETRKESHNLPRWVSNEFLRYYVLVHDDDHDDITKSSALFSQMKRHFGLHCHMLRLRSVECIASDSGTIVLPDIEWLSANEEMMLIKQKEQSDSMDELQQYLFDTDVSVIRTFVKELLSQSIIPFMETRVATWNDQVASRRRGIGGRFMSLSKRWTGFGGGRSTKASTTNSQSNYDPNQACYDAESPEALMHRLADFAFTLRDWRLASSTYELLRSDFADDKAWNHHAVANEMAAASLLLAAHANGTKLKIDTVDQLIDTASYSFLTRCNNACGAIKCLTFAFELYRNRGGAAIEEAIKWGNRLLELSILSPVIQVLLVERLAICYHAQSGLGTEKWNSRLRKAAFWDLLTSSSWLVLKNPVFATPRFEAAIALYQDMDPESGLETEIAPFEGMQVLLTDIKRELFKGQDAQPGVFASTTTEDNIHKDEMENSRRPKHSRHKSLVSRISVSRPAPPKDTVDLFRKLNLPPSQDDHSQDNSILRRRQDSRKPSPDLHGSEPRPIEAEEALRFFSLGDQELQHDDGFT